MTSVVTITLPDGRSWVPRFVAGIDQERCIGCGRCYKVCGRDVLRLAAVDEDGELVEIDVDDDDDEYEKKVMTVAVEKNCIGCEACAKVCTKRCYTHEAMALV